jgi:hypothetical protein
VPEEFGRSMQRDNPSCSSGTVQEKIFHTGTEHAKVWTPETIGHSPQRDDPQCSSRTAQGRICQEKSDQDSGRPRNPETTKRQGKTVERPVVQQRHKEPRPETAATRQNENKESEHETAATTHEGVQQHPQEGPKAGNQDFQRVADNQELNLVEGSTPSKTKRRSHTGQEPVM